MAEDTAFDRLFDDFTDEAFRLETLPAYNVSSDGGRLASYAEGRYLPPEPVAGTEFARKIIESGRRSTQVRLITEPLTFYQRCSVDWSYPHQAAAGRNINILSPGTALAAEAAATGDYWLFDSATVALMRYDATADFVGADILTDPAGVAYYVELRDRLLASSQPFRAWLAGWRQRPR